MKKLIIINGTMGVGKTSTSEKLNKLLTRSVFLDGDWCWNMNPFTVTDETKGMVIDNITYVLKNYLKCREFEHVVFCWVIHHMSILEDIIEKLDSQEFELHVITLISNEEALKSRLMNDIYNDKREIDVINRSISRLELYDKMATQKVDVSNIDVDEVAKTILNLIGYK